VDQQRNALGVLGVNLIHAAFYEKMEPETFLRSLFESLSLDRLEIDVVDLGGAAFAATDSRLWCLQAVGQGICRGLVFDQNSQPRQPSAVLRKRAIIVESATIESRPDKPLGIVPAAFDLMKQEEGTVEHEFVPLQDLRLHDLTGSSSPQGAAVLERLNHATANGMAIITNKQDMYRVVEYLRRYTSNPIRLVISASEFARAFSESYSTLPGTLLEGLAKLFAENVKVYCYPVPVTAFLQERERDRMKRVSASSQTAMVSVDDLRCDPPLDHLFRYLREAGWLIPLDAVRPVS